jgi:proteasome lid subunit RPN8/RPN11
VEANVFNDIAQYAQLNGEQEICGFVGLTQFNELEFFPVTNIDLHAAIGFKMDTTELVHLVDARYPLLALVHSHVWAQSSPSRTDTEWAKTFPALENILYIIYSVLRDTFGIFAWNGKEFYAIKN